MKYIINNETNGMQREENVIIDILLGFFKFFLGAIKDYV